MTHHYQLGNCLRGYFTGDFETDEEAWDVLSEQFNNAFPSRGGREVQLIKTLRWGMTTGGNETDQQRNLRELVEASILHDQETETDEFFKVDGVKVYNPHRNER